MLTVAQEHILTKLHTQAELQQSKIRSIASSSGYCDKTAKRALKALSQKGFIELERPHTRGNCVYTIRITPSGIRYVRAMQIAEVMK